MTPVLSPLVDELQLPITQQNHPLNVNAGRVIVGVSDVVWSRSLFGHSTCRTCFEFAVFQDREVDVAPVEIREIDSDPLADRARNRAYDTARPTIPHATEGMTVASCIACHGPGIKVGDKIATKVSHPHLTNCTQCHVEGTNPALFKGLVTRAGGENLADLDKAAPVVPPVKKRAIELRGSGTATSPKKAEPVEKAPTKKESKDSKGADEKGKAPEKKEGDDSGK